MGKRDTKAKSGAPESAVTGALPTVDLLPARIAEIVVQRRLVRKFAAGGVGAVILVVVVFVAQSAAIAVANNNREAAEAQTVALTAEKAKLAPVAQFYSDIDAGEAIITSTMSAAVEYERVIAALAADTPAGVDLGGLSLASGATGACPSQDPFNPTATAGCVTFNGTAGNVTQLNALLVKLKSDPQFTNVFVTSTNSGDEGVAFNGTVGFSDKFYSKRFAADAPAGAAPTAEAPTGEAPTGEAPAVEPPASDEAVLPSPTAEVTQ